MTIQSYFPEKTYFPFQKEAIDSIYQAFLSGSEIVMCESPPGTGKTVIAKTFSNFFHKTFILTSSKGLQKQYITKYDDIAKIDGSRNHFCELLPSKRKSEVDCNNIRVPSKSCYLCPKNKEISCPTCENRPSRQVCTHKPLRPEGRLEYTFSELCDYWKNKMTAVESKISVHNYEYLITELKFVGDFKYSRNESKNPDLQDCSIGIFDEAHNLGVKILNQYDIEISDMLLRMSLIDVPNPALYTTNDLWMGWINDLTFSSIPKILKSLEDELVSSTIKIQREKDIVEIKEYLSDLKYKCLTLIKYYKVNKSMWLFEPKTYADGTFHSLKVLPIIVAPFVEESLFQYFDKKLLLSSTLLNPHIIKNDLGLAGRKINYVSVPCPFPVDHRLIYPLNISPFDFDNQEANLPRMVQAIEIILDLFPTKKGIIHCYDEKTRVLTKTGFKFFKDVLLTDEIATLNKQGLLEYQKPINVYNYPYNGDMINIKNQYIDLSVTPNHNMFVNTFNMKGAGTYQTEGLTNMYDSWVFRTAEELMNGTRIHGKKIARKFAINKVCEWKGKEIDFWEIDGEHGRNRITENETVISKRELSKSNVYLSPPKLVKNGVTKKRIPINAWMDFLGWYIAEGYTYYDEKKCIYRVSISQKNIRKTEIPNIVKSMGYECYIREQKSYQTCDDLIISNKNLAKYLIENFGKDCYSKQLTPEILNLSSDLLKRFLTTFIDGDGNKKIRTKEEKWQAYTSSEKLKDQIVEIVLKIGWSSNVWHVEAREELLSINGVTSKSQCRERWIIGINRFFKHGIVIQNSIARHTKIKDMNKVAYTGNVGCVEVPNHIIFVEREGKNAWCGNSNSYYINKYILKNIHSRHFNRIITHHGEASKSYYDAIIEHKSSKSPSVIMSPYLIEGTDFPGDQAEFQICCKLSYDNFVDNPRLKIRKQFDPLYYQWLCSVKEIQRTGRPVRGMEDISPTFHLDSRFLGFVEKNKDILIPAWWQSAIVKPPHKYSYILDEINQVVTI